MGVVGFTAILPYFIKSILDPWAQRAVEPSLCVSVRSETELSTPNDVMELMVDSVQLWSAGAGSTKAMFTNAL